MRTSPYRLDVPFEHSAVRRHPLPSWRDVHRTLGQFGLTPSSVPQPLPGGEDNHHLKIQTNQGIVVVRQYLGRSRLEAARELEFVAWLSERGYPTPAPLTTAANTRIGSCAKRPAAVFPFICGAHPESVNVRVARTLGAMLGRLHVSGASYSGVLPYLCASLELTRIDASTLRSTAAHRLAAVVREWRLRHLEQIEAAFAQLPTGPIHGDLHRLNILETAAGTTFVVDFNDLLRGPLLIDIARTLDAIAYERSRFSVTRSQAAAFLGAYERHRGLEPAEWQLLPVALELVELMDIVAFVTIGNTIRSTDECPAYVMHRSQAFRRWPSSRHNDCST